MRNRAGYEIVIVEWKSNWFVALKIRLMHPEIVWQEKEENIKRPNRESRIEGCTMRFLKEFVGADYYHNARVNNCS